MAPFLSRPKATRWGRHFFAADHEGLELGCRSDGDATAKSVKGRTQHRVANNNMNTSSAAEQMQRPKRISKHDGLDSLTNWLPVAGLKCVTFGKVHVFPSIRCFLAVDATRTVLVRRYDVRVFTRMDGYGSIHSV